MLLNMNYTEFRNKQKSFQGKDGTIRYVDEGQGEVLFLLHGVPTSSWLYRKMIPELAKKYRVIAPDMFGYGSSDNSDNYDLFEPKEHARRILELMDGIGITSWNHVFHDAGGLWTWELMRIAPERISKMVILNTILFEEGFKPPVRFKKGFVTKIIMALYAGKHTTNLMLKGLFNGGLLKNNLSKEDLEGYKTPWLEGKTNAIYHFFSKTCEALPDNTDVISKVAVPKTIIWGKHDAFLVMDKMKDKVKTSLNLKDEDFHFLEAKHFIQEEKPTEIVSIIKNVI